jgi:hypothetical protein
MDRHLDEAMASDETIGFNQLFDRRDHLAADRHPKIPVATGLYMCIPPPQKKILLRLSVMT